MLLLNVVMMLLSQLSVAGAAHLSSFLPAEPSHCNISLFHNADKVNGPIYFDASPMTPLEAPRLSAVNNSAWEQWYFDAASTTGSSNIVMTFSRDPSMDPAGANTLFVMLDNVWDNGTRTSTVTYVAETRIYQCPEGTYGLWNGSIDNSSPTEFAFKVSADYKQGSLFFNTADTNGTWHIRSTAPSRYPDGSLWPNKNASLAFAPLLLWEEAVPGGRVHANVTIKNTPFSLTGTGGFDYYNGAYTWNWISTNWYWIRASVGPYDVVVFQYGDPFDHKQHFSCFFVEHGNVVFHTQTLQPFSNSTSPTTSEGYASVSLLHGGPIHGSFPNNTATGFAVDATGPYTTVGKRQQWHFEFHHGNVGFEAVALNNTLQFTRFVDSTKGGHVGGHVYTGQGNSEQQAISVNTPLFT